MAEPIRPYQGLTKEARRANEALDRLTALIDADDATEASQQ